MVRVDCDQEPDEHLVTLCLSNPDYFSCIIYRYEKRLSRYIRRLAQLTAEDTQDLLQDIFIIVYRHLNDYDSSLKFSSWIYRIAHNHTISHFRKRGSKLKQTAVDDENAYLYENLINRITAEDIAEQNELTKLLHEIIETLPAKYRQVFILRFLEEKDYNEISDILKKPMGSIATLINRARNKVKEKTIKKGIFLQTWHKDNKEEFHKG